MRSSFLSFSPPMIGSEEIEEVVDTLRSNWITTGPKTKRFEQDFAFYLGAPGAAAFNSCTAALHTALVACNVGPGDEVITTPMTFASSVNVIEHVGAKPVLVDVEPDTLNINVSLIESAVTARTKAMIPVHYGGHPVDLDSLNEIATFHNIHVIEDAAHAVSARYKGRPIGSGRNPVAFSFYATKNLTTAEGGMLTADPDFLGNAREISLHGMSKDAWRRYDKGGSWWYEVVYPGFKYNMTDIQASLGLCQLKKLDVFQKRRREVVEMYQRAFSQEEALELPTQRQNVTHAWHLYVLRINEGILRIGRAQFIEELTTRNIGTSVHFIPVHIHPYYAKKYGFCAWDFPIAYGNFERMLSLPLHPGLSNADVSDVIEAVQDICKLYRR
jgi:dTDP-4-amino-4,6-dideoxygalactose transaminase